MSSLVLWPHFYRKEKWLFQKLLRPISTEAHGEHLCLQKLLLDKSTRPSPSPHKPSELLQLGCPGSQNTCSVDIFFDLCHWSGEANGCLRQKSWQLLLWGHHSPWPAVMGRSQPLGAGTAWSKTALKKFIDAWRLKTLSETRKVGLLSYANELEVGKKHVFMQNDGSCIKNEGRRNNFGTRTTVVVQCYRRVI